MSPKAATAAVIEEIEDDPLLIAESWTHDERLVYAAALFEARGTMAVSKHKPDPEREALYYSLRLRIRFGDPRCGDFLLRTLELGKTGKTSARKVLRSQPRRASYEYRVGGRDAQKVLEVLRPYLLFKGEEMDKLLSNPIAGRARPSRKRA